MKGHAAWIGTLLFVVGCATSSPQDLVDRNDHARMAAWYAQEAASLREKAEENRQMVMRYEKFANVSASQNFSPYMVKRGHRLALTYTKAAEKAEAQAKNAAFKVESRP